MRCEVIVPANDKVEEYNTLSQANARARNLSVYDGVKVFVRAISQDEIKSIWVNGNNVRGA